MPMSMEDFPLGPTRFRSLCRRRSRPPGSERERYQYHHLRPEVEPTRWLPGPSARLLAVPVTARTRHVEDVLAGPQRADRHLVRIRIDADLVRIALADDQIAAGP